MTLLGRRPTLRLTITAALALMTLATAGLIAAVAWRSARATLLETARALLAQVSRRIDEQSRSYLAPVKNAALTCAHMGAGDVFRHDDLATVETVFHAFMREYHRFALLEFGAKDGDFLSVRRLPDESLLTHLIERHEGVARSTFKHRDPGAGLDEVRETEIRDGEGYDPRERPWYRAALSAEGVQWTDVYRLASGGIPAIAAAVAVHDSTGERVGAVSAAITLEELSGYLAGIRPGGHGKVFVVDRRGRLVGHPHIARHSATRPDEAPLPLLAETDEADLRALAATPELARALRSGVGEPMFALDVAGERHYATLHPLAYRIADGWLVGAVLPEDDLLGPMRESLFQALLVAAAIAVAAALVALAIGRAIARPLHAITGQARAVRRLEFSGRAPTGSAFEEVAETLEAFESMKTGLRALEKYVPVKLVRLLLEKGEDPRLGGREEELTVSFSDIRGFSTFGERMGPQELADRLGEYLGTMADLVAASGGTVDKFIGDAVMSFWNAPRPVPDHPYEAVRTALRCVEAARRLDATDLFHTRIGVHTDRVLVGNFGSPERFSYTLFGDGVNLASRLEGVNKVYGTQVLLSEETWRRVEGRVECRRLDVIRVKGKTRPTAIFEAMGLQGHVPPARLARARRYEAALEDYLGRRFEAALAGFAALQAEDGADAAAAEMARRCRALAAAPPPPGWDGVHEMTSK